jgi:hypothetical protein
MKWGRRSWCLLLSYLHNKTRKENNKVQNLQLWFPFPGNESLGRSPKYSAFRFGWCRIIISKRSAWSIFPSVWVFSLHSSFPETSPSYSNGRNILDARHLVSEIRVAARRAAMGFVVSIAIDLGTLRNSICPFGICRCYLDYVDAATVIFA